MAKNSPGTEAPAIKTPSKASFVTVASKLPMSIEMQLCRKTQVHVTGQFQSTVETVFTKFGEVHVIRGTGYPEGTPPKGYPKRPLMIDDAGYALTKKVPAEFFAEWMKQNADTEMVRNGIIKGHADEDSLVDMAMEHAKVTTGLEALNPDGDRRNPRPINSAVEQIKPTSAAA